MAHGCVVLPGRGTWLSVRGEFASQAVIAAGKEVDAGTLEYAVQVMVLRNTLIDNAGHITDNIAA